MTGSDRIGQDRTGQGRTEQNRIGPGATGQDTQTDIRTHRQID